MSMGAYMMDINCMYSLPAYLGLNYDATIVPVTPGGILLHAYNCSISSDIGSLICKLPMKVDKR